MIELKNVSKWYGAVQVLNQCSTSIQKGEVVVHVCTQSAFGKLSVRDTGPGMSALMSGELQMLMAGLATVLPQAKSGKIRVLAVSGTQRSRMAPEVPTVAEAGVPGYAVTGWYGVIAPGGTPRSAVDRLNGEMVKFLNSPEARTRLLAMGMEPIANTPDQMAAHLTAELAKWARVAKLAKLSQRSVF